MSVFQKGITTNFIQSANLLMNVSKSFGLYINDSNVLRLDTSGNTTIGSTYQTTNMNASRLSMISNRISASVNGHNALDADSTHTTLGHMNGSTLIDGVNFRVSDTGVITGKSLLCTNVSSQLVNTQTVNTQTVNTQTVNTQTITSLTGLISLGPTTTVTPSSEENTSRIATCQWVRDRDNVLRASVNTSFDTLTSSINTSFSTLANSVNVSFHTLTSSINTSLSTVTNSANISFDTLTDSINTSFDTLTDSINTSFDTLTDSINTSFDTLTDSINVSLTGYMLTTGSTSDNAITFGTTSAIVLTCCGPLNALTFNATSDERVKTNMVDLDRDHSLEALRQLKPKIYDFKKGFKDSPLDQLGFIAQEIKEIKLLAPAVNSSKGFIPNLGCTVTCQEGRFTTHVPLKVSDRIKYRQDDQVHIATVLSVENGVYQMDTPVTGEVYLYGTEIDDLHSIQKDMIYTLAVSALQRLDEIVSQQQKTIDQQQEMIDLLLKRIS